MSFESFIAAYSVQRPVFEDYGRRLKYLLGDMLGYQGIRPVIETRTKTVKSFSEKIQRPGKSYSDPLKEMTDLAGVRIICPDKHTVDLVCEAIGANFEVDKENSVDKRRTIDADRFGYASVHLIVRPTAARAMLPEWNPYRALAAEIQVRTFLAHAWAMLSHAAQYKRETEVPLPLVRRLARLSALLEIADEEVANLKRTHEAVTAQAIKRASNLDFDMPLDLVTLKVYLQSAPVVERLAQVAQQDGPHDNLSSLAQLFHLGVGARIETLQHLDEELESAVLNDELLKRFFSDSRVSSLVKDRSQIVLLVLLLRKISILDAGWLEERLNWQHDFIELLTAAIAEASGGF